MIRTLRIRQLVTIEDLTVEFESGLNVLTGETGAGKSIVVDAVGLAAGDRSDPALLRAGTERAVVEAAFDVPLDGVRALLDERGLDPGEDGLLIRREIAAGAAGRVFVNGSPATLATLREIGGVLLELHGQHEQQSLLSPDRQLDLLDAYGGLEPERGRVSEAFRAVRDADGEVESLAGRAREREARVATLRDTVGAIREVGPEPGERDALDLERRLLQNAGRVAELLDQAVGLLVDGEPSAAGLAAGAARRAAELAGIDPSIEEIAARVDSARLELQDAGAGLAAYRDRAIFDPARLEAIESRRAALERLLLRYGPDEADALAVRDAAVSELEGLQALDAAIAAARERAAARRRDYAAAARALGAARREAAARLAPAVETQLRALALEKARFSVAFSTPRGDDAAEGEGIALTPKGAERAEFILAANPGESARPLAKAASGGELSRVMLALHVVLEGGGGGRVLVFDEVDAGVSGAVASAVGARLARLARRHQVLCVTHLPQVAAHADRHYHVRKLVAGGRTRTEVLRLSQEERVDELARMLGGRQASPAARRNAVALLEEAGGGKARKGA